MLWVSRSRRSFAAVHVAGELPCLQDVYSWLRTRSHGHERARLDARRSLQGARFSRACENSLLKELSCSRAYAISKPLRRAPEAQCLHTRQGECWMNCTELGKLGSACGVAWRGVACSHVDAHDRHDRGVNVVVHSSRTLLQILLRASYILGMDPSMWSIPMATVTQRLDLEISPLGSMGQ